MSEPVIELTRIEKVYHAERPEIAVRAVDGVSFKVEAGESIAVVGPSGCGKSTLMHLIGCLDRPSGGVYKINTKEVSQLSDDERAKTRNRYIGFVFQTFNLLPRLSALENVELPLLYGRGSAAKERALRALQRVGLADRAHHLPSELSGGQQQRVAISRAIVTGPSLLLADEPTGALDTKTSLEVLDILDELNREGTTLIIVTHDLSVARRMRRAIKMRDGRVEADGSPEVVLGPRLQPEPVAEGGE
ncbi:MAG: ABC transporter ATP-binding protein [Deltaproteobacteria bacterium]|nr:ABC transporter ATP-binding protein [Deltaproteobacteria bacterium]